MKKLTQFGLGVFIVCLLLACAYVFRIYTLRNDSLREDLMTKNKLPFPTESSIDQNLVASVTPIVFSFPQDKFWISEVVIDEKTSIVASLLGCSQSVNEQFPTISLVPLIIRHDDELVPIMSIDLDILAKLEPLTSKKFLESGDKNSLKSLVQLASKNRIYNDKKYLEVSYPKLTISLEENLTSRKNTQENPLMKILMGKFQNSNWMEQGDNGRFRILFPALVSPIVSGPDKNCDGLIKNWSSALDNTQRENILDM